MLKTKRIKFNLNQRGYKAHGSPRNFNVGALVGAINGEATQERVKGRSMFGYYGHWPRIKFGHLTSVEGGLEGGKTHYVEPALVTTFIHASPDGTIEHEAEFLDTDSGRLAAKLHNSRAGGFSTVIDEPRNKFIGLDYVLEPNFRANRGYTLDSAGGQIKGAILTFDDACGLSLDQIEACIHDEHLVAMGRILDSANTQQEQALSVIRKLEQEREELLSMLAKRDPQQAATFDSARGHEHGMFVDMTETDRFRQIAATFDSADLEPLQAPKTEQEIEQEHPEHQLQGNIIKAGVQRFSQALLGRSTLG